MWFSSRKIRDVEEVETLHLQAQSQRHHVIDRPEERGVDRGSARRSFLKGRDRVTVSQTNIGNISKATLGKRLRDRVECICTFPNAYVLP